MRIRRPISSVPAPALALALALLVVAAACSSSGSSATPSFSKGLTVFYTADGAHAPVLPAKFVNCVYGKIPAGDRTSVGKLTASSSTSALLDAAGVRVTRASDQCDANLTNQLIEASAFAGAPSTISASQKSCATSKIISSLSAIDDSKLTGSNTSTVSNAVQAAEKSCGIATSG